MFYNEIGNICNCSIGQMCQHSLPARESSPLGSKGSNLKTPGEPKTFRKNLLPGIKEIKGYLNISPELIKHRGFLKRSGEAVNNSRNYTHSFRTEEQCQQSCGTQQDQLTAPELYQTCTELYCACTGKQAQLHGRARCDCKI